MPTFLDMHCDDKHKENSNKKAHRGVARISQRGVLNSADAFSADKFLCQRQHLATFNCTHLSLYHYSHYIVKSKH